MGDFGCFSFFPSKNLGAFGDGGIVTTRSKEYYDLLKTLRVHGSNPKYVNKIVGGNFRLDAVQAAVVSVKLKYLDTWTAKREANAKLYRELFRRQGLDEIVKLPKEIENRHIYNQFVILVPDKRDELKRYLQDSGIGSEVYYPIPMHLQVCFSSLGYRKGDLPVAEEAALRTLALPIYPELSDEQQACVVEKIRDFYA